MTNSARITPDPGYVAGILAEVARRGITLQTYAGKVRFRPRLAMMPDLVQRIKAHRSLLLALLSDTIPKPDPITGLHEAELGISSVASVSEWPKCGRGRWSEDELAILARVGTVPSDLPLVSAVKVAFADFGATVVSVEAGDGRDGKSGTEPRN